MHRLTEAMSKSALGSESGPGAQESLESSIDTAVAESSLGLEESRSALEAALNSTSPAAALLLFTPDSTTNATNARPSRFAWLLAKLGSGTDASQEAWTRYMNACHRWFAEYSAFLHASNARGNAASALESQVGIMRLASGSTHLAWVSELSCEAMAEALSEDKNPAVKLLANSVRQLNSVSLKPLRTGGTHWTNSDLQQVDPKFLQALIAIPQPSQAWHFEAILLSNEPDLKPLAVIDGVVHPISTENWIYEREVSLLAAVRDLMGGNVSGDIFEQMVALIAGALAPGPVSVSTTSLLRPAQPPCGTPDQIDLAMHDGVALTVGETKAFIPGTKPRAVANSFSDQLMHSSKQALLRLDHLEQGWEIDGTPAGNWESIGSLVIPIHDFGASAWHGNLLELVDNRPFMCAPLHAFTLALSCMGSLSEFNAYIKYRTQILDSAIVSFDELEPLLSWLATYGNPPAPNIPNNTRGAFRNYCLSTQFAMNARLPDTRAEWIEAIFADAHPVGVDPHHEATQPAEMTLEAWTHHLEDAILNERIVSPARAGSPADWDLLLASESAIDMILTLTASILIYTGSWNLPEENDRDEASLSLAEIVLARVARSQEIEVGISTPQAALDLLGSIVTHVLTEARKH